MAPGPKTASTPIAAAEAVPALKRLTSRSELIRQSSAALLRKDATPSLLRKTSATNIFAENEDISAKPGIELFYYSGWNPPLLHFCLPGATGWTSPPGIAMVAAEDPGALPEVADKAGKGKVWHIHVPAASELEFVLNNRGLQWDKHPSGGNYRITTPGRHFLYNGHIVQLVDPPGAPALLRASEVGCSHVTLMWNPPIEGFDRVAGYKLYRDGTEIADLGENVREFRDGDVMGLASYTYSVRAYNVNKKEGSPSEESTVTTGEPGRPSAVLNLRIQAVSLTMIELAWEVPSDHGGREVQYFRIYRDAVPVAVTPASKVPTHTWVDCEPASGTRHVYHVTGLHLLPTDGGRGREEPLPVRIGGDVAGAIEKRQDAKEGLLSAGVEAVAEKQLELPKLHDKKPHIILQSFTWHSAGATSPTWYDVLSSDAADMEESGISMLWLPPPSESVAKQGYMPSKLYNLNSQYGSEAGLKALNKSLSRHGVAPMLDLVINHRCGSKQDAQGGWTIFENPDWGPWAIVCDNKQGYGGGGAQDTGASSDCAPDIDHTNKKVREDLRKWLQFLFKDAGFACLRLDMAPGYSTNYQVEYVDSVTTPFAVGEYWSGDVTVLENYVKTGQGRLAAFDFAFYYFLRRAVEENDFSEMNHHGRMPGLVGKDPQRAVTFLDNHDTEHLDFVGRFARGNADAVLRGYAILLTHPGVPCVYWPHWKHENVTIRSKIRDLCKLRRIHGIHSQSTIKICEARKDLYATITYAHGERKVAMKVGASDWSPPGGGWKLRMDGQHMAVWELK
eukprot:GHVU01145280.1.p1 GENE.GHVU01145280.1~~GHVU01145280.1.p1  ORF type:complete len:789 (-),score=157.08 GHVU01145280.1:1095-3461(-)